MGWFWESSPSKEADPTKKLDSGLRDYLEKEAPAKYAPTASVPPPAPPTPARQERTEKPLPQAQQQERQSTGDDGKPQPVPPASLFPDGRYAHLWKNYQSLEQLEGATLAPAEKIVNQFKRRKDLLNRAALENCSEEHEILSLCFKTGDFQNRMRARMTMCQRENRQFSRCYTMQAKFLQALGYGAALDDDTEREERLQMHADKLYHQMIDYERRVAEAKEAGLEPPPPKSLFNPNGTPGPPQDKSSKEPDIEIPGGESLPRGAKTAKPLKDLTPHERELEVRSIRQQMEQKDVYLKEISPVLKAESDSKAKRREKFSGWFGETIGSWLA